ncbi:dienelactone hydrolase family protein [Lentisphaera marina]|uniref:carboxylesterase family protein n=1 Tax=Lentisphaera marina TaxID=1111041 RepID=UPI00236660DF|nr:dienelactone hydrolase family protein [Lentisphaera marina]MDD7987274.1 dienelactone hydrolase family protein [Lentisphaera marina]
MRQIFILGVLISGLIIAPVHGQKRDNTRNAKVAFKMEVVTIPESISSSFGTLKNQVLLCQPLKSTNEKSPLIISLHGVGGGGKPIESRMKASIIKELSKTENLKFGAKILVPQSDPVWEPESLSKMLDYILSQHKDIDVNRIYCVGYSMGGKGTWEWAMLEPERFAAISPKGFIPDYSKTESMVKLPIWAMVGTKDSAPRVQGISKMKEEFAKLNSNNVNLSIFEGANHKTASAEAKKVEGYYDWLFLQKK